MSKRGKAHARRRLQSQLTCRLVGHLWLGVTNCTRCGIPALEYFSNKNPDPINWSALPLAQPITHTIQYPVTPWSKIYPVDPTISLDTETGKQYHESCKDVLPKQGFRNKGRGRNKDTETETKLETNQRGKDMKRYSP